MINPLQALTFSDNLMSQAHQLFQETDLQVWRQYVKRRTLKKRKEFLKQILEKVQK